MPIPNAVFSLSIPMVLASLVMVIYNMADTYFVGMLNDPIQNAAVTLAFPVMLAFNAVNNLFGVGTSSMMSRCLGAGDYERVKSASAFGFWGACFSGIAFAVLCTVFHGPLLNLLGADETTRAATSSYMLFTVSCGAMPAILNVVQSQMVRSEGSSMHASIGTMSGCLLNIILDPIFILPWGLNMGAAGAGLATFLSNTAACVYFLVLARMKKGKTFVCMDIRRLLKMPAGLVSGILQVGVPASIQNLLNVVGSTILNNFTAAYGATPVAAMGVAQKISSIPMQISMGFSQGIMPLVSYNYASGDRKRMKKGILFSAGIVVPTMTLAALAYWIFAPQLIGLFMDNPEIIQYGAAFLRVMSIASVFLCIDFMGVGVFQALGRGTTALVFAILRKVVLEIPLLFLMNKIYPLYGLPYAQVISEFILACAAVFMLIRIFNEKPSGIQVME